MIIRPNFQSVFFYKITLNFGIFNIYRQIFKWRLAKTFNLATDYIQYLVGQCQYLQARHYNALKYLTIICLYV